MADENTAPAQANTVEPEQPEQPEQTTGTPEPAEPEKDTGTPEGTIAGSAGKAEQPQTVDNSNVAYDFSASVPEGFTADETTTKEFSDIAHGLNLNNEQANKLAAYGMQYAQRTMDAMQAAQEQQYQAWADESREKLGANFDKTVSLAGTAIEKLEPMIPNIRDVLNTNGMGNRIEVIQLLAKFGEMVSEDRGAAFGGESHTDPVKARYNNTDFTRYK